MRGAVYHEHTRREQDMLAVPAVLHVDVVNEGNLPSLEVT